MEARSVLQLSAPSSTADLHVLFEQRDPRSGIANRSLLIEKRAWVALGSPSTVTITVEPGDTINRED